MNVARKLERLAGLLSRHAKALEQAVRTYRSWSRPGVSEDMDPGAIADPRLRRRDNGQCLNCGRSLALQDTGAPDGFCNKACERRRQSFMGAGR